MHPVALLITPDKNYKVAFFAGYVAAPQDDAWEIGFTEAEFEVWLQNAADRSCFTSEIAPNISDHILTLSTCSYEFDDARFCAGRSTSIKNACAGEDTAAWQSNT